jgi:hypothetical protein
MSTRRAYRSRSWTLTNLRLFPTRTHAYRTMARLFHAGMIGPWCTYRTHRGWIAAEVARGRAHG